MRFIYTYIIHSSHADTSGLRIHINQHQSIEIHSKSDVTDPNIVIRGIQIMCKVTIRNDKGEIRDKYF